MKHCFRCNITEEEKLEIGFGLKSGQPKIVIMNFIQWTSCNPEDSSTLSQKKQNTENILCVNLALFPKTNCM